LLLKDDRNTKTEALYQPVLEMQHLTVEFLQIEGPQTDLSSLSQLLGLILEEDRKSSHKEVLS